MKTRKNLYKKLIVPVFLIFVILVMGVTADKYSEKKVTCTLEEKLCPDGTSVQRMGPNCEFAACPGEIREESISWDDAKGYIDDCEVRQITELPGRILNLIFMDGSIKIVKDYNKTEYDGLVKNVSEKCLLETLNGEQ